jgi:alcohol dehydrogenase YqhD (iron-dependent ADH family)
MLMSGRCFVEVVGVNVSVECSMQMGLILSWSLVDVANEVTVGYHVLHCRLLIKVFPDWLFTRYESLTAF